MKKGFLQYTLPKLPPSNTFALVQSSECCTYRQSQRGKPFRLIHGRGFLSFTLHLNRAVTRKEAGSKDSREQRIEKRKGSLTPLHSSLLLIGRRLQF